MSQLAFDKHSIMGYWTTPDGLYSIQKLPTYMDGSDRVWKDNYRAYYLSKGISDGVYFSYADAVKCCELHKQERNHD